MYRKCATEISARHQRLVTDSLFDLLRKMSYEDISVTQLCQAAGVTRRVFYHLFSNKTGALHALVDHKILAIEAYAPESENELLRFFRYWKEEKDFLDVLWENGLSGLLLERMISIVLKEDIDVHYRLRRHGLSGDSAEVIIYSVSGLLGLVYSWYAGGFEKTPEEMTRIVVQMNQPGM